MIAGGKCDECGKQHISLQRSTRNSELETQNHGGVPPIVHDVLRSPGQPLDANTRAFFEPRFGHDFSHVRVHTDAKAAESAQAVNALAYTVGHDVVFGASQYAPNSTLQRKLLAHELTHVIQQREPGVQKAATISNADDVHEREADRLAESVVSAQDVPVNINGSAASANTMFRYRDPKAFNFGLFDTAKLKEEQFTDAKTQPWIEQVDVNYSGTKIDAYGNLAPSGEFEATYHANAAALPSIKANILGGSIVHGLTTQGSFTVTRIEGIGYNDMPLPPAEGEGPRRKYSKALTSSMHYAVFFHKGEALHGGALDIGSHGCVHVAVTPELQQLNYHSVIGRTKVKVAYDSTALDEVCCGRMKYLGVTKKGGAPNPCISADPNACP
jgi:hypothetical protein